MMLSLNGAFVGVVNVCVPPFDPESTVPLPSPSSVTVYAAPRSVCIFAGQVGDISAVMVVCSPMHTMRGAAAALRATRTDKRGMATSPVDPINRATDPSLENDMTAPFVGCFVSVPQTPC